MSTKAYPSTDELSGVSKKADEKFEETIIKIKDDIEARNRKRSAGEIEKLAKLRKWLEE